MGLIAKLFSELTKAQKAVVKTRFKAPHTGYLYKITKAGNVQYRQKKRRD